MVADLADRIATLGVFEQTAAVAGRMGYLCKACPRSTAESVCIAAYLRACSVNSAYPKRASNVAAFSIRASVRSASSEERNSARAITRLFETARNQYPQS